MGEKGIHDSERRKRPSTRKKFESTCELRRCSVWGTYMQAAVHNDFIMFCPSVCMVTLIKAPKHGWRSGFIVGVCVCVCHRESKGWWEKAWIKSVKLSGHFSTITGHSLVIFSPTLYYNKIRLVIVDFYGFHFAPALSLSLTLSLSLLVSPFFFHTSPSSRCTLCLSSEVALAVGDAADSVTAVVVPQGSRALKNHMGLYCLQLHGHFWSITHQQQPSIFGVQGFSHWGTKQVGAEYL